VRVTNLDQKQHHYLGGGASFSLMGGIPPYPSLAACLRRMQVG